VILRCVVQSLLGAVVSVRHQCLDRLDIAAQLVGDHDPRLAELSDQPLDKPLGCFSVSSRLHENVEDVPFRVDGTPQPMFLPSNRDNDLIQMPFVIGARTIAPDAICEMRTKAINLQPGRVPADNHTALGQKVFDIGPAHCEAMVSPNSVRNDVAREPEALQAQHIGWDFHDVEITR
jgi:hypothetical protein